jgi:hypothetical protein
MLKGHGRPMTAKRYLITGCAMTAFLLCGHYGINSYFKARQLRAQAETLAVRTRLMKHQVGEMEQKVRVLQRVEHFMAQAKAFGLAPEQWSAYAVNIQEGMTFQKLSQIIEQCVHNKEIFFAPQGFHLALNQGQRPISGDEQAAQPVPLTADTAPDTASDVTLALQGTFMVRH